MYKTHKDFPSKGVEFKEIDLTKPYVLKSIIDRITEFVKLNKVDAIAALDARGFIYASPVCYNLGVPLLLVRKKSKLPGDVESIEFKKEYSGSFPEFLEVQTGTLKPGSTIGIIDDILATGGTITKTRDLLIRVGYNPVYSIVVDRIDLKTDQLKDCNVITPKKHSFCLENLKINDDFNIIVLKPEIDNDLSK